VTAPTENAMKAWRFKKIEDKPIEIPENPEEIVTWKKLTKEMGTCQMTIRRLMIFYDFPLPKKKRIGKNMKVVWQRAAINEWLNKNELPKQIKLNHV
jgi:predicted DNA-binding transcriptional regulator AlpA